MNPSGKGYLVKFDEIVSILREAKVRVISSLFVLFCAVLICFFFSNSIIRTLEVLIPFDDVSLVQLYVPEILFNDIRIGIFAGFFITSPFLIYQLSKLKIKNIDEKSKKTLIQVVSVIFLISLFAIIVSYYILIPLQLFFLLGINSHLSIQSLNLSGFVSFCLSTMFFTCLLFLFPLLKWFISQNMFFSAVELGSYNKIMIYVSLILSFLILSPPEIFTFVVFALVVYLFYLTIVLMAKNRGNK